MTKRIEFMLTGDAGPLRTFAYPGSIRRYMRQALSVTAWTWALASLILLVLYAFDRFLLEDPRTGITHVVALYSLAAVISLFSFVLARSLAVFRIEASSRGLRIFRQGGSLEVAYDEILSVEKVGLPPWWPFRADLLPWRESARRIVRIRRIGGPAVTFLSGVGGEKELLELIEGRLAPGSP